MRTRVICRSRMTRRLQIALSAAAIVLFTVPGEAAVRRIVLLQSSERGSVVLDQFTATLRVLMDARSAEPLIFTEFVVNPAGFREIPDQAMVDYLRSVFVGGTKPDLVITTGGPAFTFARRHRSVLFPDVPLLYGAVDQRFLRGGTLSEYETAVAVANDPHLVVEDVLQLFPDTANLFVIMGTGEQGRFWRQEFERDTERFRGRIRFIWPDGLSYPEVVQRASTLPQRSAIFFLSVDVDAQGTTYTTERVLTDLRSKANAPVFGALSSELGQGLIGGTLMSIERTSQNAAAAALRILSGTSPAAVRTPIQMPGPPTYDWRELRRWGVPEDRLPAGSTVLFREPGLWDRFKWYIVVGVSVLLVQTALIAALLASRARHRRAEQSLRESEGRFRVLVNSAPVMIRMSGTDALSTDFNVPWLDFTGRTLDAERGNGWMEGVHPDDLEACSTTYQLAFDQGGPYRMEYRLRRYDGEYRWILESGEPRFTPDGSTAGHIGSAVDITDLKAARATLSSLNRRLIQVQEQERSRVARELHDDVCQRMVMLAMDLQQFGESLPDGADDARGQLKGLCADVRALGRDVNAISHRLHSSRLGVLGLPAVAAAFCEEIAMRHDIAVDFAHEGVPTQLTDDVATSLFRVLQEALSNAIKHSGASRYQVRLQGVNDGVQLDVVDEGRGFDVAMTTSGLGLMSMEERLRLVDGKVSLESKPGAGTTVRAWVPCHQRELDVTVTSEVNANRSSAISAKR